MGRSMFIQTFCQVLQLVLWTQDLSRNLGEMLLSKPLDLKSLSSHLRDGSGGPSLLPTLGKGGAC